MSILIKPTFSCNFKCEYCYEKELDDAGNIDYNYDLEKISTSFEREYGSEGSVCFHGGEFLLLPYEDIEKLFERASKLAKITIQTNGFLIDDKVIELFKKYQVSVGISMDGPWPLNLARGVGAEEDRKQQYETIMSNMKRLRENDISVGVITVVRAQHMKKENIELYKQWMIELQKMNICGRHNIVQCNSSDTAKKFHPDTKEAIEWFSAMADLVMSKPEYSWQPYRDIIDSLLGLGLGTCTFTKCDLQHADSSHVILGDGSSASCCRSSGPDGIMFLRADTYSDIRSTILKNTPYEYGGCKNCKYWKICYGHCPGMAIDNDWRNRAEQCEILMGMYTYIEQKLRGVLPNVILTIDGREENYNERYFNQDDTCAFDSMLRSKKQSAAPSSWKSESKMHYPAPQEEQVGEWEKITDDPTGRSRKHQDTHYDGIHVVHDYLTKKKHADERPELHGDTAHQDTHYDGVVVEHDYLKKKESKEENKR